MDERVIYFFAGFFVGIILLGILVFLFAPKDGNE